MATNFYIDNYQNKSEQHLIEDLTIESIKFYGHDVYYLPRTTLERDGVFGEDIRTLFKDDYLIEMYIESVDGFEGEGNILAKFGMQIKDTATLVVSKKRFQETVWNQTRPVEGDLIYFPLSNSILEINFVEHENPFYQIGKLYTYKLTCELFTYSHEDFETGKPHIDKISNVYTEENIIDTADNKDIENEGDPLIIETENPKDDFLNINDNDPFGGL
jgi:hypothetical protein